MQSVDSIERDIQREKRALKYNVEELRERARDAVDWRVQVQRHPLTVLALVAGGGALLALALKPATAARTARAAASLAATALPLATKVVRSRRAFSRRQEAPAMSRVVRQARRKASRVAGRLADRLAVGDWDGAVDRRARQHTA